MDQISVYVEPMIVLLLLFIAAIIVQRKVGWKGVRVVWLASTVILTGYYVIRFYFSVGFGPLRTGQILVLVAYFLFLMSFVSGAVIWAVSMIVSPPKHTASTEVNYFPFAVPKGKLEDTYGLAGVLLRYQELLVTYGMALDKAPLNPYPSLPRALLVAVQSLRPSYVRQAREWPGQLGQVPSILAIDLIGAEVVLAELETLTPAQLSAIEVCHQVNVRRLLQGTLVRLVPGFIGGLSGLVVIVKEVSGIQFNSLWPIISEIPLTGAGLRATIIQSVIGAFAMLTIAILIQGARYLPRLQRLRAFEDFLTIAKTYRKGLGEPGKPSVE